MTTVLTVPQATVPKGAGTFTSGLIPAAGSKVIMTFTQVAWPFAGDKALDYTLDVSQDAGATWQTVSFGDLSDVQNLATSFGCDIPGAGNANRKVRVSYVFAKALTVSGGLQVV